ncbi:MAG: cadherin-like beta sandwich domain-containing protein [Ruminococcaceae bacterium]|nr:cadherin-like beta sandwich domain-containing protein [Oscillospiraceae bacterium]
MNKSSFCEFIKRIVCVIWLPLFIFGSLISIASVAIKASEVSESTFDISVNGKEFYVGDSVELNFSLKGEKEVSAFIIEAEYPEGLDAQGFVASDNIKNAYWEYFDSGSKATFIYTFKDIPLAPIDNMLTLKFKAGENIKGEGIIKVSVKGALDENGNTLCPDSEGEITISFNPEKEKAKLTKLVPSAGSLSPAFSSDIYEYKMYVPYSVSSITFSEEHTGEGKVSVNRKNLGSGGSVSEFIITLKDESGEKTQYKVLVTRGEYVRPSTGTKKESSSNNEGSNSSSAESIILEENSELASEHSVVNADINVKTESNSSNNIEEVILEEPEELKVSGDNSFTSFLLGAGSMLAGVIIGLLSLLIFKKIKDGKKEK